MFDGFEAFGCDVVDGAIFGEEEIAVGAMFVAADAATELVELGEAEVVSHVDEHGVGRGYVDA